MSCKGDLGQVGVQGGPWAPAQAVRTLDGAGLVWGECGGPGLPGHWRELGRAGEGKDGALGGEWEATGAAEGMADGWRQRAGPGGAAASVGERD